LKGIQSTHAGKRPPVAMMSRFRRAKWALCRALELIERVWAGDLQAAELFRRRKPALRRRVRGWLRMQDARLRRVFDSMDICQSVLANFLVRTAAGQFDLDSPEQLLGLLFRIAHRMLVCEVARRQAQRRNIRCDGAAAIRSSIDNRRGKTNNAPYGALRGVAR